MKKKTNICILTIHKGSLDYLKKTIQSVDSQSMEPLKHVVLLKGNYNYQIQPFKRKNREFIFNKKQDSSLYNGMNFLKKYSVNNPVIFLNSGDILFNKNSLYIINRYNLLFNLNYVLVFQTLLRFKNLFFQIKYLNFKKKDYLPHSSFLFKNDYFNQKINFNPKFKITADGIWMKKIISRSRSVNKISKNIIIQNLYGQSSIPTFKTFVWRWNEAPLGGIKEFIKLLIKKLTTTKFYFFIILRRKYYLFMLSIIFFCSLSPINLL